MVKFKNLPTINKSSIAPMLEISSLLQESMLSFLNLVTNMDDTSLFNKFIQQNSTLISTKIKLKIFHDTLGKIKEPGSSAQVKVSRIKALTFLEKKKVDVTGEFTLFKQLYKLVIYITFKYRVGAKNCKFYKK